MIGIVIVNYKGFNVTTNLVKNLFENTFQDFRIIIVNNSPAEAVLFNDSLYVDPRLEVIHADRNLGYTGGLNSGINALLQDKKITHYLLMNNDVVVANNFLESMITQGDSNNVIYSPLILYMDTDLVQNTGGRMHIWLGGGVNLNKNVPLSKTKKYTPDFLSGCILFMNRSVIEKTGLFDEKFESYVEDVDFCYRAKSVGISLEILWDITTRHFHSHSTQGNRSYKVFLLNRNQIYFAKKHFSACSRLLFISAAIIRGFLQNLFNGYFKDYYRGVKDGLKCI